ncbi:hypothetical protein ADIARSV_3758 [Arcticibacter svalbardensis MN12-7]|uniref:DUF4230 domain-containing protein n=1 Tax=Arcticibacter svalbardensis MN12-7 TaxID=1150600 RepID=R9GVW4_9SPHI|nr:DUF4230 domain-containing protein [Arcticibacter svalbardensis]EOR93069.1 hypothetical protein ADIARSV_3758 [Arcticibacter svalbardensis MN12-7]
MQKRILFTLLFSIVTIVLLVGFFFYVKKQFVETRTEITEDVMIEKITSIGKLELVKYNMKDVIEKKELRTLLPDKKILLVAAGEVAGCIDLTKMKQEDIEKSSEDSITVYLPQPEICYFKLDHKRSRVYDVTGSWFADDTKTMVEEIYKLAEQRLLQNAKDMDIMGKTRENAFVIFKPILENISGKRVGIKFK